MSTLSLSTQRLVGFGLLALVVAILLVVAVLEWRDSRPARPVKRGWRSRNFACGDPNCPLCTKAHVPLDEAITYWIARNRRERPTRAGQNDVRTVHDIARRLNGASR